MMCRSAADNAEQEGPRVGAIIFAVVVAGVALAIVLQSAVHRRRIARTRLRVDCRSGDAPGGRARRSRSSPTVLDAAMRSVPTGGVDIYELILDRVDLSRFRPKLADDIEVKRFALRWGNDYAMVANPRAMLYYRLEPWEADVLPLMDGTRTVGEIAVARLEDERELDASGVTRARPDPGARRVPRAGAGRGRARCRSSPRSARRRRSARCGSSSRRCRSSGRVRIGFVKWWYRRVLWPFFRPAGAVIAALVAVVGFVAFVDIQRSGRLLARLAFGSGRVPHPARARVRADVLPRARSRGHDRALRPSREERRLHDLFRIARVLRGSLRQPDARTPATDRCSRSAGRSPSSSWPASPPWCWRCMPDASFAGLLYKFALINYFVIFLNLIPLLELDGYWILSDLIQVPDLRPRSLRVPPARPAGTS